MGLFDAFKRKGKNEEVGSVSSGGGSGSAAQGGSNFGNAAQGGGTPGSTAVDPTKQLRVKFGTKDPLPFVDSETGVRVELRAFGGAIVAVENPGAYQSEEQAIEKTRSICVEELENQINRFSGQIKASQYMKIRDEYMMASKQRLKQNGILGVVTLDAMNLTDASKQVLEEAQEKLRMARDPVYAAGRQAAQEAEAERQAVQEAGRQATQEAIMQGEAGVARARPKFCPECGTPTGTDKFCRNCGHAL